MSFSFNKIKNFVSLIVYIKDNEKHVEHFIKNIDNFMSKNFDMYEFIIVNNFSIDNTIKIIKDVKGDIKGKITIINLAWKHSRDACMMAGCNIAIGDFVIQFEDLIIDYDIDEILKVYFESSKGYDIVSLSPKGKIRLREKLFYKALELGFNNNVKFTNEKIRIISRRAINRIYKKNNNNEYRKVVYNYSGFNTKVCYYQPTNMEIYKEKGEIIDIINNLIKYTGLYFVIPFIYLTISIATTLIKDDINNLIITIGFFTVLVVLCYVIKYIKILNKENSNEVGYVYSSIERL